MTIKITFPPVFKFLGKKCRYKVAYGGRGSGKSWAFAQQAILEAYSRPNTLILCTREIQKSIQESVHRLLVERIEAMGMKDYFEIQKTTIKCLNGSQFIFEGLKHNIFNIKSYEGVDIVWIEEAQTVSELSWSVLIPTIRKEGSEIWVSFNPDLEEDPTYKRFVLNAPPEAEVHKVNYSENPYFPDVLHKEMELEKFRNPVAYRNTWLGECKQAVEGAVFANELELAKEERRVTRVPIEAGVPINTYWDLGRSDNTAVWFAQLVGMEWRVIDYYEANGHQFAEHFIPMLDEKAYRYGTHFLPHDATHKHISAPNSVFEQMKNALRDNSDLGDDVKIVPRIEKKNLAIDAARGIFPRCVFDAKATVDGLQCLRRYRYEIDMQTGKTSKSPKHDIYSHGADAFLTLAQAAMIKPSNKISLKEFYAT